jgi:hypothetical protein
VEEDGMHLSKHRASEGRPDSYADLSTLSKIYAFAQPFGFNTRTVDAGLVFNLRVGRIGRATRLPPQLGHTSPSFD